ncbi:hypothetical protein RJ640_005728 [Escallonia rubra]|uniref:mannan endo-1,4-beta-mannosidase n=1 Tax=Escallonia rubra TaxID=112253 RepID=A0AA88RY75_9ASTE|nr:hypothetical protein RJ640_005728 [Escallonia rubra]
MDSQPWRERKLYTALGTISLLSLLYLNFRPHLPHLPFPITFRPPPPMSFVGVNSTRFVQLDSSHSAASAVYINGWNSYWLMEESVWAESRPRVSEMLRRGAEMGMTVCRTWAFSDGDGPHSLQVSPGVFNERVFRGLDYVVVEARRRGIRLILSLVNNLSAFGGKAQYVKWAQQAGINVSSSTDSFFSHPIMKEYYKSYVKAILTRKNSLSGVKYAEEPAIFAWELMNEPRCKSNTSAPALQAWIMEMAEFIKSLDQKHLVTVGLEGFYGLTSNASSGVNPGDWAAALGSDFIQNSASDNIDFASVHAYPHSWDGVVVDLASHRCFRIPHADLETKITYLSHWVDTHIKDAENVLKKPVLFTEVGSPLRIKQGFQERDIMLKTVYDKIYKSARRSEAGAGALIWQLLVEGTEQYSDQYSLVAWKHPSTYQLIIEQSCRLQNSSFQGQTKRKLHHTDPCLGKVS